MITDDIPRIQEVFTCVSPCLYSGCCQGQATHHGLLGFRATKTAKNETEARNFQRQDAEEWTLFLNHRVCDHFLNSFLEFCFSAFNFIYLRKFDNLNISYYLNISMKFMLIYFKNLNLSGYHLKSFRSISRDDHQLNKQMSDSDFDMSKSATKTFGLNRDVIF